MIIIMTKQTQRSQKKTPTAIPKINSNKMKRITYK